MPTYKVTNAAGDLLWMYVYGEPTARDGFSLAEYTHAATDEPMPPIDPADWWRISVGAFFDRFGEQKWAILASTDPMVQALIRDVSVRQFVRLRERRAELSAAIDMLLSKGYAVDKAAILDVRPGPAEVYAE